MHHGRLKHLIIALGLLFAIAVNAPLKADLAACCPDVVLCSCSADCPCECDSPLLPAPVLMLFVEQTWPPPLRSFAQGAISTALDSLLRPPIP
jgi:hypothetical protein